MTPNSVDLFASQVGLSYLFGAPVVLLIIGLILIPFPKLRDVVFEKPYGIAVFILMVIYAGGSIALAVLLAQGYNPLELPTTLRFRIALIAFAILQLPIAALRFTWSRDIALGAPVTEAIAQALAVYIAHHTSGWLEGLFFA